MHVVGAMDDKTINCNKDINMALPNGSDYLLKQPIEVVTIGYQTRSKLLDVCELIIISIILIKIHVNYYHFFIVIKTILSRR